MSVDINEIRTHGSMSVALMGRRLDASIGFYRQPGGCIEINEVDGKDADVIHVCSVEDARSLIADFTEFVDACERVEYRKQHGERVSAPCNNCGGTSVHMESGYAHCPDCGLSDNDVTDD